MAKVIPSEFIDRSRLVALLKTLNPGTDQPNVIRRSDYWILNVEHTPSDVGVTLFTDHITVANYDDLGPDSRPTQILLPCSGCQVCGLIQSHTLHYSMSERRR